MPDVTWSIVVPWTLAVLLLISAVGQALRVTKAWAELAAAQGERDAAIFERTRIEDRARDILVPLTWAWDLVEDESGRFDDIRARLYLVAAYTEIQKALLLDDVGMTEAIEEARGHEAPRRMPRYPQTPPYLASAQDVAGAPVDFGFSAHGQGETVDIPRRVFTCTDGHVTTAHQTVDLTGEPCPTLVDVPGSVIGRTCRKVLR